MLILYLSLLVVGFFSYVKKSFIVFFFCILGLMTRFFMLDTSESLAIRGEDLGLFLVIALLPIAFKREKYLFRIKKDKLALWVYIFVGLYITELVVTVISGGETIANSAKVIRASLIMLSFFLFRGIPLEDYKKTLNLLLKLTLFQTVLFFMQFAGVNLLCDSAVDAYSELGLHGYLNFPTFTIFFIFFVIRVKTLQRYRYILLIVFLSMILITFVRGLIISVIIGIIFYALNQKNKKKSIQLVLLLILIIPLSAGVIRTKSVSSGGESTIVEIKSLFASGSQGIENIDRNNGSMSFRMAMLAERIIYLAENPQYILTGVGTLHEDSPETVHRFDFILGTHNDDRALGRTIIESGDITWVPITLRYGLIGVVIHFMMWIVLIRATRKREDVLFILYPLCVVDMLGSFNGAYFEMPLKLMILSFYYAIVSRSYMENKNLVM